MHVARISASLAVVLLAVFPGPGTAQDPEPKPAERPRNKIEEFIARKGVVLVQRMYTIKTFNWNSREETGTLAVSAMHAYEADNKARGVFAVRFEGQPIRGQSTTAFLDLASAASLVGALESIISQSHEAPAATPEFMEVKIAVGDSLEVGFNQQGTVQRPFISLGSPLARILRSNRIPDLEDLKIAVAQELDKLRELGAQ